ncbi:MAG: HPr family phosphocarrier protein [Rhizobiaceae bacterium]
MSAESGSTVITRQFSIVNQRGLHARASAKFVETVNRFDAEVIVKKDNMAVDGGSILDLMMLAASPGCTIVVEASGHDADAVMDALDALVSDRFGEGH